MRPLTTRSINAGVSLTSGNLTNIWITLSTEKISCLWCCIKTRGKPRFFLTNTTFFHVLWRGAVKGSSSIDLVPYFAFSDKYTKSSLFLLNENIIIGIGTLFCTSTFESSLVLLRLLVALR